MLLNYLEEMKDILSGERVLMDAKLAGVKDLQKKTIQVLKKYRILLKRRVSIISQRGWKRREGEESYQTPLNDFEKTKS